jgi:hypothetical protein
VSDHDTAANLARQWYFLARQFPELPRRAATACATPRPGFGNQALGGSGTSDILPSRVWVGPVHATEDPMRNEALNRALEARAPHLKIGDELNFHQLGYDKLVPDWTANKP